MWHGISVSHSQHEFAAMRRPWTTTRDKSQLVDPPTCFTGPCYGEIMSQESILQLLREFVSEREWGQFHSSSNLAKSISIEAGELLECFQWGEEADPARVQTELADVLTYAYLLADRLGVEPDAIVATKLEETRSKYPVEKARGRSAKYDQL